MNDKQAFFNDWTNFIQEMSLIGVDPKPANFGVHDGFLPGQHVPYILTLAKRY